MRTLISGTNIDGATGDYLKGRVRDKAGGTPGSIYNEVLHGDLLQLIHKLVGDAGITENGLPDNETNGFQLKEALVYFASRNSMKRVSSTTAANVNMTSSEQDIVTFTFDANNDWDDIKTMFSCSYEMTSGVGSVTNTFRLYVDGVLKETVTAVKQDGSSEDFPMAFNLGGTAYTANTIVKVTGKTSGSGTFTVSNPSLIAEGINV